MTKSIYEKYLSDLDNIRMSCTRSSSPTNNFNVSSKYSNYLFFHLKLIKAIDAELNLMVKR